MKPIASIVIVIATAASCTTIKMAVPEQFSRNATQMPVKGLSGWAIHQRASFGNYATSTIKKGWNTTSSTIDRSSGVNTEERLLKVFNINQENNTVNQKNKYQFSINDGNITADIFCMEKSTREELVVKTNSQILGDIGRLRNSQYSFSAAILPQTVKNDEPWQVVLYSIYDAAKDTARRIFDLPNKEEGGYATNGKETITIRPLRIKNVTTKNGKEGVMPFRIPTGYELRIEDGVVAIVDTFGKNVWIYNDLDAQTKLILASIASSLLLKKISDYGV